MHLVISSASTLLDEAETCIQLANICRIKCILEICSEKSVQICEHGNSHSIGKMTHILSQTFKYESKLRFLHCLWRSGDHLPNCLDSPSVLEYGLICTWLSGMRGWVCAFLPVATQSSSRSSHDLNVGWQKIAFLCEILIECVSSLSIKLIILIFAHETVNKFWIFEHWSIYWMPGCANLRRRSLNNLCGVFQFGADYYRGT